MRMFLDPDHVNDQNVSLFLATSGVRNVGLDSPSLKLVFRYDFPSSVFGIMQETGRAGRVPNENPLLHSHYISHSLEGFMCLRERTMDPNNELIDESHRFEQVIDL